MDNDKIAEHLAVTSLNGDKAEQVLSNPAYIKAWEQMTAHLDNAILNCKTVNAADAADIVRCKQLMVGLRREFERLIESGEVAKIRIKEIERAKTPIERIFKR